MLWLTLAAQAAEPEVKLYTMGRGPDLFALYGHASLCLETERTAHCFNYGTTIFTPDTVTGFFKGTSTFWVAVENRRSMLRFYASQGREVWVQTLPLDLEAKRKLATALVEGAKEENRYYIYDHFRDNCATRLRDLIDDATDGKLQQANAPYVPYREAMRTGLAPVWPLAALTEFGVGGDVDLPRTTWDGMFLPEVLRNAVEEQLGVAPTLVLERKLPEPNLNPWYGRLALLGLTVGGAALTLIPKVGRWVGYSLVAGLTLLGLVVWTLLLFGGVGELTRNECAALLLPLDVLFFVPKLRRPYVIGRLLAAGGVVVLGLLGVLRQPVLVPAIWASVWLAAAWWATVRGK